MALITTIISVTVEGLRNGGHSDGAGAAIYCAAACSGLYLMTHVSTVTPDPLLHPGAPFGNGLKPILGAS